MAKILLAEDEAVIRMLLVEMLVDDGHQVIEAADGAQALALLEADVAVLISDVMMPRLTGDEWVTAARGRPGMDMVPVVFMSALPLPPAAKALATAVLQKPFRPTVLVKLVQEILTGDTQTPHAGSALP
ncbi:response regulator [Azospirillum doebereinerae]|uniref:response regulator n=1 Tax=Azospirillum doebereinerae TaxID=92933 RepID=UPI001EE59DEA|nr:response regulator [Azospirillum doebereinerae]